MNLFKHEDELTLKIKRRKYFFFFGFIGLLFVGTIISELDKQPTKDNYRESYKAELANQSESIISNLDDHLNEGFNSSELRNAFLTALDYDPYLTNRELKDLFVKAISKNSASSFIADIYNHDKKCLMLILEFVDSTSAYKIVSETLKLQYNYPISDIVRHLNKRNASRLMKDYPFLIDTLRNTLIKTSLNNRPDMTLQQGAEFLYDHKLFNDQNYENILSYIKIEENSRSNKSLLNNYQSELRKRPNYEEEDYAYSAAIRETQDIITLSFYVIAQVSYYYEIQPVNSSKRAILITNRTEFESRGLASLKVRRTGTKAANLKQEYGGFTQQWPEYTEVSKSEILKINDAIRAHKDFIVEKEAARNELPGKIQQLKIALTSDNNKLAALRKKLPYILNNK